MSDKVLEEVSALMDGEATELELHRVLKCAEDELEVRKKWQRYHLARSVFRGETRENANGFAAMDISLCVSEAITDEPAYALLSDDSAVQRTWKRMVKPIGSVAVAASVSAMVVFGWQSMNGVTQFGASPLAAGTVSPSSQVVPFQQTPNPSGYVSVAQGYEGRVDVRAPALQEVIRLQKPEGEHFNRYILSHSGNTVFNTASGAVPYARVVTLKSTPEAHQ